MSYSFWLAPFGWGIFSIGLITAIILYAINRKFYPVMYLVSIATHIFTIGFVIDAFKLSKDLVLIILGVSSLIFIVEGFYFSKKLSKNKEEFARSIPSKRK